MGCLKLRNNIFVKLKMKVYILYIEALFILQTCVRKLTVCSMTCQKEISEVTRAWKQRRKTDPFSSDDIDLLFQKKLFVFGN
jgi:hypothetical protein